MAATLPTLGPLLILRHAQPPPSMCKSTLHGHWGLPGGSRLQAPMHEPQLHRVRCFFAMCSTNACTCSAVTVGGPPSDSGALPTTSCRNDLCGQGRGGWGGVRLHQTSDSDPGDIM